VSEIAESIEVHASLAESWDYHFEPRFWPAWVDGFAAVVASDGYPEPGGRLRWRSTGAGRGEVAEEVLEHSPRRLHRIAFHDPQTEGELLTAFEIHGGRTRVEQRLTYRLLRGGIFGRATDFLFIRSQQRGSMRRSLTRLKTEVEARSQPSAL
jgi:hypothetical protein